MLSNFFPLAQRKRHIFVQIVVMVKPQRALNSVNQRHKHLVKHNCPGSGLFIIRNVIATAEVPKNVSNIG